MSKTLGVRGILVVLILSGLWIASSQRQRPPQNLKTVKVADNLYVLVGAGGNVAVYITGDGVILVDDKFDRTVPQILAKVKALTSQPIRYILSTHHHGDHTGGNAALLKNAEVLAHANARQLMVEKHMPGLPRITFADKTSVYLGGKQVHAYYLGRGHTRGDVLVYFPEHKVLHTGDLFIETAPFIDYLSGGSGLEWPATLDRIAKLDFETVIPGHGPVMTRDDFLKWRESFRRVLTELRRLKKEGKSEQEVAASLQLADYGWKPGRAFLSRSLPGLYKEMD